MRPKEEQLSEQSSDISEELGEGVVT